MAEELERVSGLLAATDHFAVVATARPDGSVHASLVKAGILDDPVTGEPAFGLVVVRGDSRKLVHLRRSGLATVVVQDGPRWIAVEGPVHLYGPQDSAEKLPPEGLRRLLRDVFRAAGGTHGDWAGYDRAMASQGAVTVLVQPRRVVGRA